MNIQTAYFGEVDIEQSNIITFEHGIPGFEEEKQFILMPLSEESVFEVLQSVQTKEIAFMTTPPASIVLNYHFDLDEATIQALDIKSEEEVHVYVIMSLKESFSGSTVNLKAPIVINATNNKAKQVILSNEEYIIRQPISSKAQQVK